LNKLTAKQELFCEEVVSGKTQADAYRTAYSAQDMKDKTIWSKASELMTNGKVTARLEELRAPVIKEAQLTLAAHLNNLLEIRESAVEDRNWSAAVSAETARGKAAGLHTGKAIMSIETGREDRITVIELVAGTREN
jgi:phage terminase small subunit